MRTDGALPISPGLGLRQSSGALASHSAPRTLESDRGQPQAKTLPRISSLLLHWFTWYCRGYIRRHFHSLRVSLAGFKIAQADGRFNVTISWTHKSQGYMSTPVIIDGVAYEHLKSQRVMAIEVATGRELWTSDKSFGKYWSLVAQGDRILALDQRKLTDAETWAHLALAGDELFVRELNGLIAYRWNREGAASIDPQTASRVGPTSR